MTLSHFKIKHLSTTSFYFDRLPRQNCQFLRRIQFTLIYVQSCAITSAQDKMQLTKVFFQPSGLGPVVELCQSDAIFSRRLYVKYEILQSFGE